MAESHAESGESVVYAFTGTSHSSLGIGVLSSLCHHASASEADEAEIAGYLDEMLSLLPVLGVDAFGD